jgi:uncharacterized protein (PEP-CTERM system associated)
LNCAYAADVKITPSVAVSETFTDNVDLTTGDGDRKSDYITTISPGLKVRGVGARANFNLNYAPQYNYHQVATDRNGIQQNLLASGHAELWQRVFFLDSQASINQAVANSTGAISNSPAGQEVNRTEVKAFNISPSFRHHFGAWANTEARITDAVVSNDSGSQSAGTAGLQGQTTNTLTESFHIGSGRHFTTLLWALDLNNSKTSYDIGLVKTRKTLDTNYTYIVNRQFSLLAGIGYEDIKDPTLPEPPKGVTWNAGAAWRPSLLTSIRATTGERDGGDATNVEAMHRFSGRTTITANYNDSLQTSQGLISQSLNFLTVDSNGVLVDTRTGLPFVAGSTEFGLQNNTFRQKTFRLRLIGSRKRNTFSGGIDWESRKTELTGITETVTGGDFQLTRELSRVSTGTVALGYHRRDHGTPDGRKDDELSGVLSYAYRLVKDADVRLTYDLTWRKSNISSQDLTENSITLALIKRF